MINTTQDLQASFATNSMPSMPASEDKDLTDEEQDIIYIPSDQEPQQEAPETEDLQAQHSHNKQFATTADATATPQETQQGTDSDDAPTRARSQSRTTMRGLL